MPELPEVETVRRALSEHLTGQCINRVLVREPRLRHPVDTVMLTRLLVGRRIVAVRRRAKYLLIDLSEATTLMIHLGMSGRLSVSPYEQPHKLHDHVIFGMEDGRQLSFNDPRRFGLIDAFAAHDEALHPRLQHLGVEPLDSQLFHRDMFFAASRNVQKPVKNFLMDATQVVGVGNIYACESLFAAGIHPRRAAGRLSLARCGRLVDAVRRILNKAIAAGGTTLRDFASVNGEAGYFRIDLHVYGREGEPCRLCAQSVKRIVQAGRSTFFCSGCQH